MSGPKSVKELSYKALRVYRHLLITHSLTVEPESLLGYQKLLQIHVDDHDMGAWDHQLGDLRVA